MSVDQLIKRANFIDKMDAITGPFSALCYQSGSDTLATIGGFVNAVELAVKIPFAISYVAQTGDKKALFYWGVKEVIANVNPTLGYIDIVPFYAMRTKYFLREYDDSL